MNYQDMLNVAAVKMAEKHSEIIDEIKDRISSGSTGSEITMMVGKYLKDLKYQNSDAYLVLQDEIEAYLLTCKKQGLIIS